MAYSLSNGWELSKAQEFCLAYGNTFTLNAVLILMLSSLFAWSLYMRFRGKIGNAHPIGSFESRLARAVSIVAVWAFLFYRFVLSPIEYVASSGISFAKFVYSIHATIVLGFAIQNILFVLLIAIIAVEISQRQ